MKSLIRFLVLVLSSTEIQAQWVQINGPYGGIVDCFAVSGTNLFVGTGVGVFLSTNNGTSWTGGNVGMTDTVIQAIAISGANLFAGTWAGGVFRSTNNGTSWITINAGLSNSLVRALAVTETNLFAGTLGGGVFRSSNNGTNWTAANTGIVDSFVLAFTVSPAISERVFAGTGMGGVFLSTNGGTNWTAVNSGLTNTAVRSLTMMGTKLFAGTWGGGVYLSTNSGTSWIAVNAGLTDTVVHTLAAVGTNLFAGTDGGVFLSTNSGTSWIAVNTGLTSNEVWSLAVSGMNLFAGTSAGVWRRPLSEMVSSPQSSFYYQDFSSISGLNLVGDAAQNGNRLRLTPSSEEQRGGAWFAVEQPVANGFETTFQFQLSDLSPIFSDYGADGLAFVIQNNSWSSLGGIGGGIGYGHCSQSGIPNSLAIEFDTYNNFEFSDPNNNHVSVQTRGLLENSPDHAFSLGTSASIPNISDSSRHLVRIVYVPGSLKVYLDNMFLPALDVAVNLANTLNLDSGRAWIGFTAATASGYESHDLLNWSFDSEIHPFIGRVTFYHDIPRIPDFATPFVIAEYGETPKICADSSNATLVSYQVDSGNLNETVFRIREDPNRDSSSVYGSFSLLTDSTTANRIVFRYNHPSVPPPASFLRRRITLEGVDAVSNRVVGLNPIDIYRAPVLMVHGLWSYASKFDAMQDRLLQRMWVQPLTFAVDYGSWHARHFAQNAWVVPFGANHLIRLARNDGFSSGRVDVVAHSMGGILSRLYLQSDYYQGNINRLITLNTPHSGSQGANLILDPRYYPEIGYPVYLFYGDLFEGAVSDLSVDSPAILHDLNGPSLNNVAVPSRALVTLATVTDLAEWPAVLMRVSAPFFDLTVSELVDRLYNHESSDMVVPISSQQGNLDAVSIVDIHQIHTGSPSNQHVIDTVISLLNLPDGPPFFSTNGFHPDPLHYNLPAIHRSIRPAGSPNANIASITITSPPNGAMITPGQNLEVLVNGSGDVTKVLFIGGNSVIDLYSELHAGSATSFSYSVPPLACGKVTLCAIGFDDSSNTALDTITVYAVPSATLDSLDLNQYELFLPAGNQVSFSYVGVYSDGVRRDLRLQTGVTFTSTNENIARVPAPNLIEGVSEGTASITVSYQARSTSIEVHVLPSNAWTTVDNGQHGGTQQTAFSAYSLSNNFPNPFNPITNISFTLPHEHDVTMKVFDILGREVATLVRERLSAGAYTVQFDGRELSSGVYFCRLEAGSFVTTNKVLLLK